MRILANELQYARVVTYYGPETSWEPAIALEGPRGIIRVSDPFVARTFPSVTDAVTWARANGFHYVSRQI